MSSNDDEFPIVDFSPYSLPREYLAAIGLVATNSAQTENCTEIAISALAKTDIIRGAAITTHMSAPLREGVIKSLAQLSDLPKEALDELDAVLDRIKNVSARRNAYLHNSWGVNSQTGEVVYIRTTAKSEFEMHSVHVPLDVLYKDAAAIYDAGMGLISFLMKWNLDINDAPAIPDDLKDRSRRARKKRTPRQNS